MKGLRVAIALGVVAVAARARVRTSTRLFSATLLRSEEVVWDVLFY
jgi:hypothetical protein